MENKIIYIYIFLMGIFISSISQILLKKSAIAEHKNKVNEYLNLRVVFAYTIFVLATLLSTIAYKVVPLSLGPVLECTGYIYISILSYIFLNEKMSLKQITGTIIIIIGVLIFSL